LLLYNGLIIEINQQIYVNSETISTLEIINVPSYGSGELSIFENASYAIASVLNDISPDGDLNISVDKQRSYAVIDMSNGNDVSPEGTFSITIISNI
jgi:hypothetical protein